MLQAPLPIRSTLAAAALAAAALSCGPASAAGLLGTTVTTDTLFPTVDVLVESGGPSLVGDGVEYGKGSLPLYSKNFFVDLTDTSIIIGNDDATYYVTTDFNGFAFTFGSVMPTGASVSSISGYAPTSLSFVNKTLFVNFAGLEFEQGTAPVVIDLQFADGAVIEPGAVPEPTSWALMILGFGGVGAMLRRRPALAGSVA